MEGDFVGVSEYARRAGLNKSTVSRQIASGIIPVVGHDGRGRPLIDPEVADTARARYVEQMKSPLFRAGSIGGSRMSIPAESGEGYANINEAKATKASFDAKQSELDYLERTGKIVAKESIEQEAWRCARELRNRLLAIPKTIAGVLAAEQDERVVADLLRKALTAALSAAADTGMRNTEKTEDQEHGGECNPA
jgi:hypothetical protein